MIYAYDNGRQIYVYDNGRQYSDRAIHFISVPERVHQKIGPEIIDILENVPERYYGLPKIIATASQFDWRHPRAMDIEAFLYDLHDLLWMENSDEDRYSKVQGLIRKIQEIIIGEAK